MDIKIYKDLYIRNTTVLSLALLIIAFGVAYFSLRDVNHLLVIRFTGGKGIDFLGTKNHVFGIAFSGLALNLINVFLIGVFYERIKFFSYLLSFFNIFLSALILIAVAVIISVN